MLIRARPKYLSIKDFSNYDIFKVFENEYFFNQGRKALEFYLLLLRKKYNKSLNVLLQDFNCNVVIDAILKSDNNAILADINLTDFSIDIDIIKNNVNSIDVVILTHYQGIPNKDYLNIVELCRKHNIIVIEDMAHTYKSKINNVEVGTLGDVSVYSYAFDKPFSAYEGGLLIENRNVVNIENNYKKLKSESDKKAKLDIEILKFLIENTTEKNYQNNVNQYELIRFFLRFGFSNNIIKFIVNNNIVVKVLKRIVSIKQEDEILKLHKDKISLIKKQMSNFNYQESIVLNLENMLLKNSFNIYKYDTNFEIKWNRYSLLDKDKKILKFLLDKNIEVGNFNWSRPLHERYRETDNIKYLSNFKNSQYASKNIINIPIWRKLDE